MPRSRKATSPQPTTVSVALLIGTRKGAFILRGDRTRHTWKLSTPMFLGQIVHHLVLDPRDRRTILLAARTGHLGPTVFRSTDFGKVWKVERSRRLSSRSPRDSKDASSIMSSG